MTPARRSIRCHAPSARAIERPAACMASRQAARTAPVPSPGSTMFPILIPPPCDDVMDLSLCGVALPLGKQPRF